MDHFFSLLQTVLWVGLIGWVFWRYHERIDSILYSLNKRMEKGAGFKLGPVELLAEAKPQTVEEQAQKLQQEAQEISESAPPERLGNSKTAEAIESAKSKYLRAEDLALRALQAEFGVSINRQVAFGPVDLGFDAMFVKENTPYLIEVKYVAWKFSQSTLSSQIMLFNKMRYELGWKKLKVVLAIVFEESTVNTEDQKKLITESAKTVSSSFSEALIVRCYTLSQLEKQFRI